MPITSTAIRDLPVHCFALKSTWLVKTAEEKVHQYQSSWNKKRAVEMESQRKRQKSESSEDDSDDEKDGEKWKEEARETFIAAAEARGSCPPKASYLAKAGAGNGGSEFSFQSQQWFKCIKMHCGFEAD